MMEAVKPMLAETAQEPFDDPKYVAEWKWNGMRIVARKRGMSASLQGRSGADYTAQFPELKGIVAHIGGDAVDVDGEVVCLDANGLPEFNRLQQRIGKHTDMDIHNAARLFPATFMVFDIVRVNDFDLTAGGGAQATWLQRREILEKLVSSDEIIKLSPYVDGTQCRQLHQKAVDLHQEGVMVKTKTGLYYPGGRTQDWLKLKVPKYDQFAICGWTKGTGWREDIMGAIVLGKRETDGRLRWVGCAGSGFTQKVLEDLYAGLQRIQTQQSPFDPGTKVPDLVSWVKPILVAEVKYYDITKTGQLIWPIFQRVVTEKAVEDL